MQQIRPVVSSRLSRSLFSEDGDINCGRAAPSYRISSVPGRDAAIARIKGSIAHLHEMSRDRLIPPSSLDAIPVVRQGNLSGDSVFL